MKEKEFTVPLRKAFGKPRSARANKMILEIRNFIKKHLRKEGSQVVIDNEVNEFIFKHSSKLPRRIEIQAIEKDSKQFVFLKSSKKAIELLEKTKEKKAGKEEKIKEKGKEKMEKTSESTKRETAKEETGKKDKAKPEEKQASEKAKEKINGTKE